MTPAALRSAAWCCHWLLLAGICALTWNAISASPAREIAAVLVAVPLLATERGLRLGRPRALPWLALLLVIYIGAATVEVIATAGAAWAANLALLAACGELGLLLALSRHRQPAPPAAPE